ncbi:MAG TPA: carbon monoxide dehydrogenase subunit G [Burkholderiales bacterium]
MEMSNAQLVPASAEETWKALNDPAVLKECIPGCESFERVSENEYALAMTANVGPVNAKFKGRMKLEDVDPPRSYRLVFEGQGGSAGFAKGSATVTLSPDPNGTKISYTVHAQVGGKLAQIGSRLIDGAAKKTANDFFGALVAGLGGTPKPVPQAPRPTGKTNVWFWVAVGIVLVVLLYFLFR